MDDARNTSSSIRRLYGAIITRRLRAMGIRDRPTAPPRLGQTALLNG